MPLVKRNADEVFGGVEVVKSATSTKEADGIIAEIDDILHFMIKSVPSNIDLVAVLQKEIKDPLFKYKDGDGNIQATKIPDTFYIVAIVHKLISIGKEKGWDIAKENDFIYLYNGKFWVHCAKDNLYKFFKQISERMNFYSPAKAETTEFKDKLYKQFLTSASSYKADIKTDVALLNVQNGTLEVKSGKAQLREHRKEDFIKYALPFDYNEAAAAPIFNRYLNEILSKELQEVLQDFCGYIFISHLKLEKCLVCYGSGANGKSVFFEVISSLLGSANIATKSLGDLTDGTQGAYSRATIKDKLVNYGSEIKGKNVDVDIFKRLVSGEPVQARLPYGNPFDLKSNIKFIFNANELPRLEEHNNAVFRRFIIVPFERTIPKERQDKELHLKIARNELAGVLNWLLQGLERVLANKSITEPKEVIDALAQYKRETDTVALFVEEQGYNQTATLEECFFKSSQALYNEYRDETKNNGHYPLGKSKFLKRFKDLGFEEKRENNLRGFLLG